MSASMMRSSHAASHQAGAACAALPKGPVAIPARILQSQQTGFSGRTNVSAMPSLPARRASIVPTSTATVAYELTPSTSQVANTVQQVAQGLLGWLPPAMQAVGTMCKFLGAVVDRVREKAAAVLPPMPGLTAEEVHKQLRSLANNVKVLALVAPLARAASSESLTALYARTFERAAFGFAKMYLFCLFMRVLLSWFPGIDWNAQPWTFLRLITEPYLQIYRGILPPLFGQLDFTPLFGFLILQDVVEVMAPTYTMGLHDADTSTKWTTSDVMCYFDGF